MVSYLSRCWYQFFSISGKLLISFYPVLWPDCNDIHVEGQSKGSFCYLSKNIFIDHKAGQIIRLVASVCPSVHLCSTQEAFKMVGHSKWLLFRQVVPLQLITLLIRPHKIDSMFYLRIFVESYARVRKNNTKPKNYAYFTTGFLSLCIL